MIQPLNLIEGQAADIVALRLENQQLRDENGRLKGGFGKPDLKPLVKPALHDHFLEAVRHICPRRGRPKKNATLTVTYEDRCVVNPSTLP